MNKKSITAVIALLGLLMTSPAWAASLTLTWTDTSTNEAGFNIERRTGIFGPFNQIATVATDVETYVDNTLVFGTNYCYRLNAFTTGGVSPYSNIACKVPVELPDGTPGVLIITQTTTTTTTTTTVTTP